MCPAARQSCPDEATFRALLHGGLPAAEVAAIVEHAERCASCGERLSTSATVTSNPGKALAEVLPDPLSRYELLRELGSGGQSTVWLARDRHLGREVAFKRPRVDASGAVPAGALAGFLREARITSQLEHPHIVPVHEIGKLPDGTWYCTQRLIRGEGASVQTLGRALAAARTLEQRLALLPHLQQVCSAVAHAHARGVIHRDLKPENVVIGRLGETVVLDWGLARGFGEEPLPAAVADDAEQPGAVVGTPLYMAPEQARGELGALGPATDVWALGAMLHELLTGVAPFVGSDVAQTLAAVRDAPLVPIREREAFAPPELAAVAARCLQRDPRARYASVTELADELAAWSAHRKVAAYSYTSLELVRLLIRRYPVPTAMLAAALVVLTAVGSVAWVGWREARRNLSEAFVEKARLAEAAWRWDHAAVFYAAARVQEDTAETRFGASLSTSRADVRVDEWGRHEAAVTALAQSHDRRLLASGGRDGRVLWWDTATGARRDAVALTDAVPVMAVAFSKGDDALFVATERKEVVHVHLATGAVTPRASVPELANALALSPDGKTLAVGCEDRVLRLFEVLDGDTLAAQPVVLAGHSNPIYSVAWSPDGAVLASGSWDRTVRLWPGGRGPPVILSGHADSVLSVHFVAAGAQLVSTSRDSTIRVWDVARGEQTQVLQGHEFKVYGASTAPSGLRLASVGTDRTLRLWLLGRSGAPAPGDSLRADDDLSVVSFLDEDRVAFAGASGAVRVKRLSPAPAPLPVAGAPLPSNLQLCEAQGRLVHFERELQVRDPATLQVERRLAAASDAPFPQTALSVSRDGQWVAGSTITGRDSWLVVARLDGSAGGLRVPLPLIARASAFSPDGRWVAALIDGEGVLVYDTRSGALLRQLPQVPGTSLDVSPDGRALAVASYEDRTIRLYDTERWTARVLGKHEHGVYAVRYSPDGALLASAGWDRVVKLWEPASGRELARLEGHRDLVRAIAFGRDGRLLASGGLDGTIRFWDVQTHALVGRYVADEPRISGLAFGRGGDALFYLGDALHRLELPDPPPSAQGLAQVLATTGLELKGTSLVKPR